MAGFSCMVWVGPALGHFSRGFLQRTEDWRWGFYVILWKGGGTALLMFTLLETYAPIILRNKARRIREAKVLGYENVKAPIEETDRTITGVYKRKGNWNSGVGQLLLIGAVVGALLGGVIVVMVSRQQAKKQRAGKVFAPEDRLILAMIGGVIFPIAIFWFAWTGEYNSVHWIVHTIASVSMRCGIMLIFVCYFNYIVDSYPMYAASANAANTVARSAAGAAAPLFTDYMFEVLGVVVCGSLPSGVATLLAGIPFVFYRYGERIRLHSKIALTLALKKGSDDEETHQTGNDHTGRVFGSDAALGEDVETAGSRSSSTIHEGYKGKRGGRSDEATLSESR